jgi:hypothetical protein
MAVNTSLGIRIYLGTTTAATNQTEYEADSYTEIGEVENHGEFGDVFNPVTFSNLKDGRVRKFKGTRDAGTFDLVVGMDKGDTGQAALLTAMNDTDQDDYNVKIVFTDGDADASPVVTATTVYFSAKVMSYRHQGNSADGIPRVSISLAINTGLIEVDAA